MAALWLDRDLASDLFYVRVMKPIRVAAHDPSLLRKSNQKRYSSLSIYLTACFPLLSISIIIYNSLIYKRMLYIIIVTIVVAIVDTSSKCFISL